MLYKNLCNKSRIIEGNNLSSDKYSPGPEVIKLFPANNKLCYRAGLSAPLLFAYNKVRFPRIKAHIRRQYFILVCTV